MKALVIKDKLNLAVEEVPMVELQSEEEVIIKIAYTGVCHSDIELYGGTHPYILKGISHYPIIPGHEWSGTVYKVGSKVKGFKPGDRVVGDVSLGCGCCQFCKTGNYNLCPNREVIGSYKNRQGSYAEYLRTHYKGIYKIADSMSLRDACTIEAAATGAYSCKKSNIKYGDKVLVIGDGPIGLFALQCAKAFGASKVNLISGSSPKKKEVGYELGADLVLSYRDENYEERILDNMDGELFDVVIESSGDVGAVSRGIRLVKPCGTVGLVGFYGKQFETNINDLVMKNAHLVGILASPNMFAPTLSHIAAGNIKTTPLITHEFDFADIKKAFDIGYHKTEQFIKMVIKIEE